jgi:hypothetical protein
MQRLSVRKPQTICNMSVASRGPALAVELLS